MKLKDLFEHNPVAFLDEMVDNTFIGDQPLEKQDISFDVAYSRPVGTFNGLEIWGSKYFGKNKDLYGILDNQRSVLAWAVFDLVKHPGYSTFERAYTVPKERGKNHILTIINFLVEKAKEKVLVDKDELTSNSSRKMFKKWFDLSPQLRHFTINFFENGKKIEHPDLHKIFQQGERNQVYIILEDAFGRNLPRYGAGRRILRDFIWYD
ncbi:MAG: hypothetical protein ACREAU_00820 [Nitrosopumilaceae archaeon]